MPTDAPTDPRRRLPAVGKLLTAVPELPAGVAAEEARALIAEVRAGARAPEDWVDALRTRVNERQRLHLRRVINATGVVLHTNLGRAPLSDSAVRAVSLLAPGWSNLEWNATTGERGERLTGVSARVRRLACAEAACAVNNNAAAVLLVVTALAAGKEVIVSRGEAVEIGGSFRVPDVIASGGARLREVGTTNRTRVADFERAIGADTALILRVHPSNFRVEGYTEAPDRKKLQRLAQDRGIPLVEDLGSGALFSGLGEPTVRESLETVDAVTFSGDKLLGGPQSGLIAGRSAIVAAARKHALYRALRLDRLVLAALEGTLADAEAGIEPYAVQLLRLTRAELRPRAAALAAELRADGLDALAVDEVGVVGGGSAPGRLLPTCVVRLLVPDVDGVLRRLRLGDPPVVARAHEGAIVLDLRTVAGFEAATLRKAVVAAAHG